MPLNSLPVDMLMNDPLVGRVIDGRYIVLAKIAEGGMATVYRAHDERLDRVVAVKVMKPALASDTDFVTRFIQEARAAARLSHPNVVNVFDQGRDGEIVFLAMDYVEGRTLRELLDDLGSLTVREAFGVLEPVLAALGAAHRAGFIHRDVKPENILISDDGVIKVADFGLARTTAASAEGLTGTVLIGTVSYLSPEQVERGETTTRTDVYAAGMVLFEMLTGGKPFDGAPVQVIYRIVHEDVPPPSARVPGLAPAVDALVRRATARDPGHRPVDADDFLAAARRTRQTLTAGELDAGVGQRDHEPTLREAKASAHPPQQFPAYPPPPGHAPPGAEPQTPMYGTPAAAETPGNPNHTQVIEVPFDLGPLSLQSDSDLDEGGYPPPPPPEEPRGPGRAERRRRGPSRGVLALIAVLVLAVGIGVGAWWYGTGRYSEVPATVGKSQAEALKKIKDQGLKADLKQEFSLTTPSGMVISSDPIAGKRLLNGKTVSIIVSKGPELFPVPAFTNITVDEARKQLQAAHLGVGTQTRQFSETVPEGKVIGTNPAAGQALTKDTAVGLVISSGPDMAVVPDLTGRTTQEAQDALTQLGFTNVVVAPEQVFHDSVPGGRVASQSTQPNQRVAKKTQIILVLSKGQDLVPVPDVNGKSEGEARTILEGQGFKVKVNKPLIAFTDRVNGQGPAQGSMAKRGSEVEINIAAF